MHGRHDDRLNVVEQAFAAAKEARHNAQYPAAGLVGRAGRGPHEADAATSIDQPPAGPGRLLAKRAGRGCIGRIGQVR